MPREIEASVQMRLYTLSKRHLALVFAVFFVCFAITVLIGILGPKVIYTETHSEKWDITKKINSYTISTALPLNSFNQQLWLLMTPELKPGQQANVGDIRSIVNVYGIQDDKEISVARETNHSRRISCTETNCTSLVLLHIGYLQHKHYMATVQLSGLKSIANFESMRFEYKCYRSAFTQLELWFRFAFLGLTFGFTIWFSRSLKPYSWKDWSIEQKWMTFLLPLLLLYNNPLFALEFLVSSSIPSVVDGLFQATFLCTLLLFWLCLYHSIREPKRKFLRFYLPKLLLIGMVWLAAVTLSTWQSVNEVRDPTFNFKVDTVNFTGFKIFLAVVAGFYTLYFLYLLIRAFVELHNVAYFDTRLKFTTLSIVIVFIVSLTILILRFGTGILDANFVSDISTKYSNSAEFLSFYGLINFYIYTMAYVYSPSKHALYESRLHDNPVISMLNDSDEDVMYGSDKEDSAKSKFVTFDADSD